MNNPYRTMMEEVTLSPAARSAIAEKLAQTVPAGKSGKRILHTAIAAACLCILLPLTALGAALLLKTVTLGKQTSTKEESFYKVEAGTVLHSLDSFSDALRADLEQGTLQRVFNDKDKLEAYLGFSLIPSAVLEEAGIVETLSESFRYGWDLIPELAVDTSARYILSAEDLEGNENYTDPDVLKVSGHRVVHNMEIYLEAWIITDLAGESALEAGISGERFSPVTSHYLEFPRDEAGNFILDENGNPTVVMRQHTSAEHTFLSETYPMSNGCTATIITVQEVDHDGSGGFREYMGYFLSGGILYTVKPYAIYDPHQDFPMEDSDALIVLKEVLNVFE